MENKTPLYMQVAQRLIEQLKSGTAPWIKPWNSDGIAQPQLPYNEQSGKRYRGINIINLMLSGREDPRWMTFKQAELSGFKVNKGEKGTMIQFVKTHEHKKLRDEKGNPRLDHSGSPIIQQIPLPRPIVSNAWVFNAEQISGLSPLKTLVNEPPLWNPLDRAESLISLSGADISHKYIDRAYYDVRYDAITMPDRSQFDSAERYYATILHELGHWTGHPSRLDRESLMSNGLKQYAREELRAEISSMLLADELKIPHDPSQHAAYIESWVSILEDTPFEIFSAAADAEKIFSFLTSLELKRAEKIQSQLIESSVEQQSRATPLKYLSTGDEIAYNGHLYRIQGHLKQGRLKVEQMPEGMQFTLAKTDQLYSSLLKAKIGAQNPSLSAPGEKTVQNTPLDKTTFKR